MIGMEKRLPGGAAESGSNKTFFFQISGATWMRPYWWTKNQRNVQKDMFHPIAVPSLTFLISNRVIHLKMMSQSHFNCGGWSGSAWCYGKLPEGSYCHDSTPSSPQNGLIQLWYKFIQSNSTTSVDALPKLVQPCHSVCWTMETLAKVVAPLPTIH